MKMRKMKMTIVGIAAVIAASMTICALCVLCALAGDAAPTKSGEGVSGSQTYDSSKGGWQDNIYKGTVRLFYETKGGSWTEPDPDNPSKEIAHDNGTYVVTLPTKVRYSSIPVGSVSMKDIYDITVCGAIGQNQVVTLSAESGKKLSNGSKDEITVRTYADRDATPSKEYSTGYKRVFTAEQVYGSSTDGESVGHPVGTTVMDTITLTGKATAAGTYKGSVTYTARLVERK